MSLAIRAAQPLVSTAEFKLRPRPSMKKMKVKVTQSCPTLLQHHGLYSPWNSPGQNARVGSLSLLQGIFPTQGSNPGLPHCRWIFYQLSHQGSPRRLEWVVYPFSSGSSRPRNQTRVSCTTGGFFTNWAVKEALCPSMALVNDRTWIHAPFDQPGALLKGKLHCGSPPWNCQDIVKTAS